jgi:hypothetical protein
MSRSSFPMLALTVLLACGVAASALVPESSSAAPWVTGVLLPVVPGQAPNPVMPGGVATLPVLVTAQTGLAFTATPSVVGGLPPGATVAFSPPSVLFDGTNAQVTVTLLVYTTLATPENDYPLTVQVAKSDAPGDVATYAGHLSVHRARFSVAGRLSLPGHAASEMFGNGLESAGDFNADGYPDLMVSDVQGIYGVMGHVYLFYGGPGADGTPDLVFTSGVTGDYYGDGSALAAFDVDGDGYSDIVIGAGNHAGAVGRVYIYYGGPSPDTVPDMILNGFLAGYMFGEAVADVGDQNGDGHDDLLVGAYCDYNDVSSGTGRAYLYYGGPGMHTSPDLTYMGFSHWETFGRTVHGIGDVNGDGMADFLIGAYWGGSAYVYYGSRPPHTSPDVTIADVGDAFAGTISSPGDVNGDGYADVFLPQWFSGTGSLYYGGAPMDGLRDLIFSNEPPAVSGFGESIPLPDVDGDGWADFALGTGATQGGIFSFFRGGPAVDNVRDFTLWTESPGSYFGYRCTRLDGFFGDGRVAMALSAPYDSRGLSNRGQVYVLSLTTTPTAQVTPIPPATCIAGPTACVDVPVRIARADAAPLRGYSVDVQLSGNLALCPPLTPLNITEGTYLGGGGGGGATSFQVVDNGGGSYTVDCAILGLPCGATASSGTLFTLHLASSAPSGTGTVTIDSVTMRDCDNGPLAAFPGPPASITIDNQVPSAVVLSALQKKTSNDVDGTTKIDLSWTGTVAAGDSVLIYRAGWGNYPEYDDVGGGVPAIPTYPPGAPWALAGYVLGPGTSFTDEVTTRDFWYYVAFVKDPCGSVGPVSNRTGGTLNYHLGDVSDGSTPGQGDNQVFTEDISLLGFHYGITLVPADPFNYLDVGPTTDYSVDARPTTDNKVNFEDLMMFAINYNLVSAPGLAAQPVAAAAAADALSLQAPAQVVAGETFAVTLRLQGAGDLQGISAQLAWDRGIAEPVAVEAGDLLSMQNGMVLSSAPGNVDAALLGPNRGLMGEGTLATVTFRALGNGDPKVAIATVNARDVRNQPAVLAGVKLAVPAVTSFAAAAPNPFHGSTTLSFGLAKAGEVTLAVYGVDGRKVTTLASGVREAGTYRVTWDGRDGSGQLVRPGLYYARLTTPQGRFTRTLALVK